MSNNWQPIETAPKDGTIILVCEDFLCYSVSWQKWYTPYNDWYYDWCIPNFLIDNIYSDGIILHPTHWMPLPELPKGE
jgi:hypothetical protein